MMGYRHGKTAAAIEVLRATPNAVLIVADEPQRVGLADLYPDVAERIKVMKAGIEGRGFLIGYDPAGAEWRE
ncbi:MAG: hypothetical protein WC211_03775 [Dehalococcoidia bacterium]